MASVSTKAADFITEWVGCWAFVIVYNILILVWLGINIYYNEDTLALNLFLSWLAGVQAPIILISQNRQETVQRRQELYQLHLIEAVNAQVKLIIEQNKTDLNECRNQIKSSNSKTDTNT